MQVSGKLKLVPPDVRFLGTKFDLRYGSCTRPHWKHTVLSLTS